MTAFHQEKLNEAVLLKLDKIFKDGEETWVMSKTMEDMRNESLQEGKKEEKRLTVLRMLEIGKYALEEIAEIAGLPLDEVKKLQTGQNI